MWKYGLLAVTLISASVMAESNNKFLHYKFNDNVAITISNVPCLDKSLIKDYPYAVVAVRIDQAVLKGCFTHKKDDIVIQWIGGDQTTLPANAFLVDTETGKLQTPQGKATIPKQPTPKATL